ncbi:hypothetical protein Y032_0670g1373 [Ancylostoma ceylanicum]|uniref:Uncharacterized protein n=1 Tax=Ancylostoma ceylanicum TaxID=53326 RepID=A0A016WHR9_9BILA|nr:hypothetical protein Y032_0670g1373 [Ancylostoma ceylanicum]
MVNGRVVDVITEYSRDLQQMEFFEVAVALLGSVAQNDGNCSLAFSDVWRCQTMIQSLTGQVCFRREVNPKTRQQLRKNSFF